MQTRITYTRIIPEWQAADLLNSIWSLHFSNISVDWTPLKQMLAVFGNLGLDSKFICIEHFCFSKVTKCSVFLISSSVALWEVLVTKSAAWPKPVVL